MYGSNLRPWAPLARIARIIIVGFTIVGCCIGGRSAFGQGLLNGIRNDVRVSSGGSSTPAPEPEQSDSRPSWPSPKGDFDDDTDEASLYAAGFFFGAIAATSPFWAPHSILHDDFSVSRSFASYPYADDCGYMSQYTGNSWGAQFAADYATEFNDVDLLAGRLVFDTVYRVGIDTSMKYFQETIPQHTRDNLWLGDFNVTYRFAQSDNMQWRTGLGFNWMDDPQRTDFGFNFTYGFDWFPRKPWVVSTEIDWGNLNRSGLFHFRSTVGAMLGRLEAYTGYEYYDFDHVQTNMLIGGVRCWF